MKIKIRKRKGKKIRKKERANNNKKKGYCSNEQSEH
jgi:hypothetical protein